MVKLIRRMLELQAAERRRKCGTAAGAFFFIPAAAREAGTLRAQFEPVHI